MGVNFPHPFALCNFISDFSKKQKTMEKFSWKLCMQAIGLSFFVLFIFSCNKDEDPWAPPPPLDTNFIIQASSPPLQIQCGNYLHWWSDTAYLDVDLDSIKDILVYFGTHSNNDIMVFYQSLLLPELWLIKNCEDMRNVPKWCWTTLYASWINQKLDYLGIRVQKEDGYHYGWIKTFKTYTNYTTNRIDELVRANTIKTLRLHIN
jgi:hypothetical protein